VTEQPKLVDETRLLAVFRALGGEAFRFEDLEIEVKSFGGVDVKVVTARTLWNLKRGTVRPVDRIDAAALADRFGFWSE
jgi:hypothetical protein